MSKIESGKFELVHEAFPIMTANAYNEDIKKAFTAGMNGHLSKPVDINAMIKMLVDKICTAVLTK